jgi:hypothetical protein
MNLRENDVLQLLEAGIFRLKLMTPQVMAKNQTIVATLF